MANDMSDAVRGALGQVVKGALKNAVQATTGSSGSPLKSKSSPLSGMRGMAAGAGLAAAAPMAYKGIDKLRHGGLAMSGPGGLASKAGDQVGSKLKDSVSEKVDQAGGAGGLVKEAAGGLLPGGGGDGGSSGGMPGVGKGRRMPVQQAIDIAAPIETVYNQWTQFEDWPNFMHRVTRVTQEDDCTLSFATKIWGKTKEFTAKIETQRPDERIKWRVSQGLTHSGVVTFHELAPRLTRVELTFDVDPGSLIEKAARGMRHVKRAARADLHRFKAFIEMQEMETGAWRGVIEDGELVEPHDPEYDEERDYSDVDDIYEDDEQDSEDEESGEQEDGDAEPRTRTGRFARDRSSGEDDEKPSRRPARAAAASSSSSRSSSGGNRSGGSRSSGSRSSGNGAKSGSSRSSSTRSRGSNGSGNGRSSSSRQRGGSGAQKRKRPAASRS
jgi:uncharacterized membrane protein